MTHYQIFFPLLFSLSLGACTENPFGSSEVDNETGGTSPTEPTGSQDVASTTGDDTGTTTGGEGGTTSEDIGKPTDGVTGGDTGGSNGCGDLKDIATDFNNNAVPSGFEVIETANFTKGQMELIFLENQPISQTSLTAGIVTTDLMPVGNARVSVKISGLPDNSNTQSSINIQFQANKNGETTEGLVAELGRAPGGGFLSSRDGTNKHDESFDDSNVNWLSMRLEESTISAEASSDGINWTVVAQVPRLGNDMAKIQLQAHKYGAYNQDIKVVFDDLNINCPSL